MNVLKHGEWERQNVPTQQAIPLDGLPLWAQLAITVIVGLATLLVAFKGYFFRDSASNGQAGEKTTTAIMAAQIADMGAIRHLSDTVIQLTGKIETMMGVIEESTHHQRVGIDLQREICARLRELREVIERMPR